jgi:hypothetical protein
MPFAFSAAFSADAEVAFTASSAMVFLYTVGTPLYASQFIMQVLVTMIDLLYGFYESFVFLKLI